MISTGTVALDINTGTMNPSEGGKSAGQESVSKVFKIDQLPSPLLRTDEISFHPPKSWSGYARIVFKKAEQQELYQAKEGWDAAGSRPHSEWTALRKDTPTHGWLFGTFRDPLGKSVFLFRIPRPTGAEAQSE